MLRIQGVGLWAYGSAGCKCSGNGTGLEVQGVRVVATKVPLTPGGESARKIIQEYIAHKRTPNSIRPP